MFLRPVAKGTVPDYAWAHPEEYAFLLNRTAAPDAGFRDYWDFFDKPVSEWVNVDRLQLEDPHTDPLANSRGKWPKHGK
jgi:hypothetical protein